MNCANHPDIPVAAYCQNCGKPLCSACVRSVADVVLCEQCLAARLGVGPAGASAGYPGGIMPPAGANPALATLLGFIPGVGAMYNGQYVKAIVHVLVFVVLVAISGSHGIFGIFVAAWVLYQVFDANQTAKARRDGRPLPDPFGLNELSFRMGVHMAPSAPGYQAPPAPAQPWQTPSAPPSAGFVSGTPGPAPGAPPSSWIPVSGAPFTNPQQQPWTPPYPGAPGPGPSGAAYGPPEMELEAARREPIGAIVLIGLGMLFLFNTLGIFSFEWIDHGWPLLIIGIGIWLLIRRMRHTPAPAPVPPPPPSNDHPSGGVQ
ncbi:B-box zinc finger protein [Paracidobacterium acidisoli]|uniref:B box-type domain-containing protein n=1 Tax=Paracidobacterium acidisoli TaxID=2303751 RepID=A0A372INY9_9BACT|nr:B-box zinc finger protein [Paracidobacterium acidisoli]MBT9332154.1 B-box zinc finger protein [Paracidobacterium acidisoli]